MATTRRTEKLRDVAARRQSGLALVLEDIHDPHNAAAILRTCDALGVQDVYFIFEREKPWNPRRVGRASSSSANKWLTFYIFRSVRECFAALRRKRYKVIATAVGEKAENIFSARFTAPRIALVVGNEHRGISDEARRAADRTIAIPMQGMVESLNVSVAAALCIFEVVRQRQAARSRSKYRLSPRVARALARDFEKRGS